jgi:hypothetical protein
MANEGGWMVRELELRRLGEGEIEGFEVEGREE